MSGSPTRWLLGEPPRDTGDVRLFCFPHAGGGASAYQRWRTPPTPGLAIVPVQLPGRENRLGEAPERDLPALIARLHTALEPWFDRPFAFFGHSMGALIAFELARVLVRRGATRPVHLFLSARPAPGVDSAKAPIHQLADAEFVHEVRALNGTPDSVLQHPELMALMLPLLRADFALVETYCYRASAPLDIPITVFGGIDDTVSVAALDAWREETTRAFRRQMLPGGHCVLQSARDYFVDTMRADLRDGLRADLSPAGSL